MHHLVESSGGAHHLSVDLQLPRLLLAPPRLDVLQCYTILLKKSIMGLGTEGLSVWRFPWFAEVLLSLEVIGDY